MTGQRLLTWPPRGLVPAGDGGRLGSVNIPVVLRVLGRRHTLRQRDRWTREQLLAHQAHALRQLRDHAYAHSPFYQRLHAGRTDRPLHELPVLTKAMVMEHFDELVTDPAVTLADVEAHLAARVPLDRVLTSHFAMRTRPNHLALTELPPAAPTRRSRSE